MLDFIGWHRHHCACHQTFITIAIVFIYLKRREKKNTIWNISFNANTTQTEGKLNKTREKKNRSEHCLSLVWKLMNDLWYYYDEYMFIKATHHTKKFCAYNVSWHINQTAIEHHCDIVILVKRKCFTLFRCVHFFFLSSS